ncbi:MAG: VWA domain-containing protein [Planctomycetes bacterium]|nr:VWA domain-containing protein [Planctomycetota bacterium]
MRIRPADVWKALLFGIAGLAGAVAGALPGEFLFRVAPQESVEVCLLLDCSGSMRRGKLEEVKAAATRFVRENASRGPISVVGFDSDARPVARATTDVAELERAIAGLDIGFSTAMDRGLAAAEQEFTRVEGKRYVFVFTDGNPDSRDRTRRIAESIRAQGISIVAVATFDASADYLDQLTGDPRLRFQVAQGDFGTAFEKAQGVIYKGLLEGSSGSASREESLARAGGWTALLALGLAAALTAAQNRYLRRGAFRTGQLGLLIGGLVSGLAAGVVGQLLYASVPDDQTLHLVGRIGGWVLLGGLTGLGMSYVVPNLRRLRGLAGGAFGGAAGALGFLSASPEVGDFAGRLIGAGTVGLAIGMMIALVEAVFRQGWLEVVYGRNESSTVSLGSQPVSVGSDARACTVYAAGAPPVAYRFTLEGGRVRLKDVPTGREEILKAGDRRTIGGVTLVVHAGEQAEPERATATARRNDDRPSAPPSTRPYSRDRRDEAPVSGRRDR